MRVSRSTSLLVLASALTCPLPAAAQHMDGMTMPQQAADPPPATPPTRQTAPPPGHPGSGTPPPVPHGAG